MRINDVLKAKAGHDVITIKPDATVRERLRPDYAENADSLIAIAQCVATEFATIAAANNYWR